MKTYNRIFLLLSLLLITTTINAQRELTLEEIGADGDVIVELITNDLPSDPSHRNMILGINQSNEGFLRMISDHDLSFWTDNIRRITIDNNGLVGMGTSLPGTRLHVLSNGASGEKTIVQTLESNTSNRPILQFSEAGSDFTSGMSIEYDGRLTGTENQLNINNIEGLPVFTIESGGDTGVGTEAPLEKLDVNGKIALSDGTGEINFYEGTTEKGAIKYNGFSMTLSVEDASGDINLAPVDDVNLDAGDDILFRSGGTTRMLMNDLGKLGIGTTIPAGKLDVRHLSTATDPLLYLRQLSGDYARIRMTSNSVNEFWNLEARSVGSDPEMNFVYNDNGTLNTIMSIDGDASNIGINKTGPLANLHIKQVGTGEEAFRMENDTDSDHWSFEIGSNDLFLYFNNSEVGNWNDSDGVYSATSDRRLKSEIVEIEDGVLQKILKLEPSSYYYKRNKEKTDKSIGFIAQDLQEQFPALVTTSDQEDSDLLSIKYSLMGVYTVKAIQEQQDIIEELKNELESTKKQVAELIKHLDK